MMKEEIEDKELLQEKLVSKGYAKVAYLYGDYKYTKKLQKIEQKAKDNKVGIWSNNNYVYDSSDSLLEKIFDKLLRYIRKEIKSML